MTQRESSSLEDQLRSETPPQQLHAADVDLMLETYGRFMPEAPPLPVMEFVWHDAAESLVYRRWVDSDGEWYYLPDAFRRRSQPMPSGCGHEQPRPTNFEVENCEDHIVRTCRECKESLFWSVDEWRKVVR